MTFANAKRCHYYTGVNAKFRMKCHTTSQHRFKCSRKSYSSLRRVRRRPISISRRLEGRDQVKYCQLRGVVGSVMIGFEVERDI